MSSSIGEQGSCSQLLDEARRAQLVELLEELLLERLDVLLLEDDGTGTTIAKFSGGPLYAFCMDKTVRVPSRINATCVASLNSFASAPLT